MKTYIGWFFGQNVGNREDGGAREKARTKNLDFYQQVPGPSKPWHVREARLERDKQRVTLFIRCDDGMAWAD